MTPLSNTELLVTIIGQTTITFNDFSSNAPAYVLHGTAELLSTVAVRVTKTPKQGQHGLDDSLAFYDERTLTFDGEIIGSSQADRKSKEEALKKCLAFAAYQSFAGTNGYLLVQFTDEDSSLKQCYAKVIQPPKFTVIDNTDPTHRAFDFVMMCKDPFFYSQTLNSQTGTETVSGTSFSLVSGVSTQMPFTLYSSTINTAVCVNNGTTDAPPVLTINGPTLNPKVTDVTSGNFMYLNGLTLLTGEKVVIDVNARSITKYDVSSVASNASAYLTGDSNWIVLRPGSNSFTLLDASPDVISSTLQVQWRDTFI